MPQLADPQGGFAAALLDHAAALPPGLVAPSGWPVERRFRVYRNNVLAGLGSALELRFPVVRRLVGEAFFRAMARDFVLAAPPRSPLLLHYGEGLPAFIEGFAPAAELPYLADVARLENAWWRAYHAAEARPIEPAALAVTEPATLLMASAQLHPSLQLVTSPHPIVAIWATNTQDETVRPITAWTAQDALVSRPGAAVELRSLPPGGYRFLAALLAGASFAAAAEAAQAASAQFDLACNLKGMLEAGALVGIRPGAELEAGS